MQIQFLSHRKSRAPTQYIEKDTWLITVSSRGKTRTQCVGKSYSFLRHRRLCVITIVFSRIKPNTLSSLTSVLFLLLLLLLLIPTLLPFIKRLLLKTPLQIPVALLLLRVLLLLRNSSVTKVNSWYFSLSCVAEISISTIGVKK